MIRKAKAVWRGTGRDGGGTVSTDSGALTETPYSFRTRFENEKGTRACLHSARPENNGDDVDHSGKAGVGLFVARCDASKRLQGAEEVFDEVPPLVFFPVMLGVSAGSFTQRNDCLDVVGAQLLAQPTGVEPLIADQGQAMDAGDERREGGDVVPLSWQKHEADQIAQGINEHCDFRG